jgi:two-component system, LuxR family, response regulator FixJ
MRRGRRSGFMAAMNQNFHGLPTAEGGIIAVVDDDDAVRESLQFLLETAGYDVHGYASAQAFLPEAGQYDWRYLVVDQHMPSVTGLDLVARLCRTGQGVPTLLISGSVTPDMVDRAAELGVRAVLEKPLASADLLGYVAAA